MEVGNRKTKISRKERNFPELLVEESHESVKMIEVWKHIQEDILEVVLTWLLIVVLFRFRLACRKRNSIQSSLHFQQIWREVAPKKQPWFFVKDGGIGSGLLYDPFTRKWNRAAPVPLPALASTFPLTSSEGLVCFLDLRHTAFFVGNTLNQTWRWISCTRSAIIKMEARSFIFIGMVTIYNKDVLISPWNSKIVLLENNGNFEVFTTLKDLLRESPMTIGKIPFHVKVPSYLCSRAVSVGMNLLFLRSNTHGIISYNVVSEKWSQLIIPRPLNSSNLALIECNGRILLTGVVKDTNTSNISIRVWKIGSKVMRMWIEIDRMPNSVCSDFYCNVASYECLCNKNVIINTLKTSHMTRLYTYDVENHDWSKVSKLKDPSQKRTTIVTRIGFFPGFVMP